MYVGKYRKIEKDILEVGTKAVRGNCAVCKKEVDGGFYCFGCQEFICDDCDRRDPDAIGIHNVSAHRKE